MFSRFHALIAVIAKTSCASSSSSKEARACSQTPSGTGLDDEGHRLAELECRAFALAVERALAPGVEAVEALFALARGACVLPVHVHAERAAVDLRRAQADQVVQAAVELDRLPEAEHRRELARRVVDERQAVGRDAHGRPPLS